MVYNGRATHELTDTISAHVQDCKMRGVGIYGFTFKSTTSKVKRLVKVGSDGGPRSVYRMTKKGREALEHYNKLLGLLNLGVPRVKKPELFGEEQLAAV